MCHYLIIIQIPKRPLSTKKFLLVWSTSLFFLIVYILVWYIWRFQMPVSFFVVNNTNAYLIHSVQFSVIHWFKYHYFRFVFFWVTWSIRQIKYLKISFLLWQRIHLQVFFIKFRLFSREWKVKEMLKKILLLSECCFTKKTSE